MPVRCHRYIIAAVGDEESEVSMLAENGFHVASYRDICGSSSVHFSCFFTGLELDANVTQRRLKADIVTVVTICYSR